MGLILELRMCDADREKYGGEEWIRLDVDQLLDLPSKKLRLYELQTGYPIERAYDQVGSGMPAVAAQVLVWLARKQSGDHRNTPTGEVEPFSALDDLRTMRLSLRWAREETVAEDDAVPPALSEQPGSTPAP